MPTPARLRVELDNGDVQVQQPIDAAPDCNCGQAINAAINSDLSLTYNSDTASPRPIIEITYQTDPNSPVPNQLQVTLTWGNNPPQTVDFSTSGHSPGDNYLLSVQVANPMTTTGAYSWSVDVQANLPGGETIDSPYSGVTDVVANGTTDPYGVGWSVGGAAQLFSDGSGGYFWAGGNGGTQDFQAGNGTTFVSPPNNLGTLVKNSNGTFTYTNPEQERWNFNSQGQLTSINRPDGPTQTFSYNGSGAVSSVTDPGGFTAAFTYNGSGHLSGIQEPGGRMLSTSINSSDDLTSMTLPDGTPRSRYKANGRPADQRHWPGHPDHHVLV